VSNNVQAAVGRLAATMRRDRPGTPEQVADARNGLLAAKLERAVLEAVRPPAPYEPLRREDRERLAEILMEG
jgi:hypothetical protein